jgi:iron complex outermembrane receptor protein
LSARLAVKVIDQDGWLKNAATGSDDPHTLEEMARLSLRYQPTSNFDITGKVEFANYSQKGDTNVAGPTTVPHTDYSSTVYEQDPYGPTGLAAVNGVKSLNSSVTANYHFDDYTVTSITGFSSFRRYPINGYDETNPSGGPTTPDINNIYQNGFPERFNQESEEVRFLSPTGRFFEYVVGAYYDHGDWNLRQNIFYDLRTTGNGAQYTDFQQYSDTYSAYGVGTFHFTDKFRFLTSIRYTDNVKSGSFTSGTYYGTPFHPVITTAHGNLNEGSWDPSGTLQYDLAQGVMVYGSVAHGSKSGGFVSNTFSITDSNFTFKPEQSLNYEIGLKSTLDSGRVIFDADIYHLRVQNLQVSSYVPSLSSFVTNNAAAATSQGFEASASWLPITSLQLSTSVAYLDAKYDNFPGAACLASDPVSVCNPASPSSVEAHNLAGKVLEYASKWTGNVQARYMLQLSSAYTLSTSILGSLRSKFYNADNYSTIYGIQPTTVKWDARIELDNADGWDVALAGKNLTNEHTASNTLALPASVTTQARTISYMDEYRSIWIEGTYRF